MGDYTFLYRGGMLNASPEERQKHMEKWMLWFKDIGAKGLVKEPGHPLESSGKVVSGKAMTVNDGPFAEAKEMIGGIFMLTCETREQAIAIASECPVARSATIEVRELGPCFA